LRVREEKVLRDPDDVYLSVRDREAERIAQGLPARIRFLDQDKVEMSGHIEKDSRL
jgi:hypothetical protein